MNQLIRDLKSARYALYNYGWIKNDFFNADGFCMAGAIDSVCFTSHDIGTTCLRVHAVNETLAKYLPDSFDDIIPFNDHPETTLQDVLDLFDKALADLGGMA
ncbi:hypothetical protein DVS77_21475 [Mycolicibacterium moriokaense]|nr:hypothetical protein DVS77_21475 [Mycolicibacterium moriokaense]